MWVMHQYGRPKPNDGMWCLLTNVRQDVRKAPRKRADKKNPFAELRAEGWTLMGPYPKRLLIKHQLKQRF